MRYDILKVMVFSYTFYGRVNGDTTPIIFRLLGATVMFVHERIRLMKFNYMCTVKISFSMEVFNESCDTYQFSIATNCPYQCSLVVVSIQYFHTAGIFSLVLCNSA